MCLVYGDLKNLVRCHPKCCAIFATTQTRGNGHCVKGSRQIDINLDPNMQLSDVTSSFLNYGPEGGQRCVIAMARSAQGMVVQIRGAGKDAAFQRIFFYPWSAPLISLPLDTAVRLNPGRLSLTS
jgi:hypothetical protein